MATFDDLPAELLVDHVVPYLKRNEVAALAKASGTLHRILRRVRLYSLWPLYNRRYIQDAAFREEVKRWIPLDRLVLGWRKRWATDLSAFSGVHSVTMLDMFGYAPAKCDLSCLRGVHTVSWRINTPVDLSPLADVRELVLGIADVSSCRYKWPVFRKARSITLFTDGPIDLRCVEGVPKVDLSGRSWERPAKVSDLSPLRNSRDVKFFNVDGVDLGAFASARKIFLWYGCHNVRGLPSSTRLQSFTWRESPLESIPRELAGVRYLDLSDSKVLRDVAAARNVHTLLIDHCTGVRDVSALGSVHRLEFAGSFERNALDVSCLGRVHTLRLRAHELLGVASLTGVHELDLSAAEFEWADDVCRALGSCHTLNVSDTSATDLSSLGSVHTLVASSLEAGVRGMEAIGNCHSLHMSHSEIEDVSMLGRVHTLNLFHTRVVDTSALGRVYDLCLEGCEGVSDASMLGGVHTLNLASTAVSDATKLGSLYKLCLRCTKVTDVSMLGNVHELDISECNVADVSALGRVHTLRLDRCRFVTDVSRLEGVCVLSVVKCPIVDRRPLERVRHLDE